MIKIPASLQNYIDKLNERPLRERVLVLICIITLIILAFAYLLIIPLQTGKSFTNTEIDKITQQITQTKENIDSMSGEQFKIRVVHTQELYQEALAKLDKLNKKMISLGLDETKNTSLEDIVIHNILANLSGLQLMSWGNATPTVPNNTNTSNADKSSKKIGDLTLSTRDIVIQFEGQYTELVNYLKSLEPLYGKLLWDSLDYKVAQYPNAVITLQISIPILDGGTAQ